MHKFCFFLTFILLTCLGYAKPVSEQEAIQIANDFLFQKKSLRAKALSTTSIVPQLSIVYACRDENKPLTRSANPQDAYYYVININSNDGYIIISGDDRAKQILAYSNEGSFDPENIPVNCNGWIEGYKEEISQLMSQPEKVTTNFIQDKTITYPSEVIEPLIKTHWGQGNPYNIQCPIDSDNKLSVVGCVATAIAQIMYYHKWPEKPSGFIEYEDGTQIRKMNFDERPAFDWNNMITEYNNVDATQIQKNAVANLMVCAGHISQMSYSSTASGAFPKNMAVGLRQYLNYDPNIHYYESNLIPINQWINLLIEELKAKRPVQYSGRNPSAGHSFVCDGYDGNGMFHFNWGWNGTSDGYFSLSSLKPNDQGIGGSSGSYTFDQYMVTNIQRPTNESKPQKDYVALSYLSLIDKNWTSFYNDNPMEIPIEDNFAFTFYLKNIGMTEFNGETNVGIVNADNQIITISTDNKATISSAANASQWEAHWINIKNLNLPIGTYNVYGLYKTDNNKEWSIIPTDLAVANSYLMTVTENKVRMEKIFPHLSLKLNQDFNVGRIYSGNKKIWKMSLLNNSNIRFAGKVGIHLKSKETVPTIDTLYNCLTYCEPGETINIDLPVNIDNYTGECTVTPFYCSATGISVTVNRQNIIYLSENISAEITKKPLIYVESQEQNYVLDKKNNSITVKVTQPSSKIPWNGRIYGKIFKKDGISEIDQKTYLYSEIFTMNVAFETREILLKSESVELPIGDNYKIIFCLDDGNETTTNSGDLSIIQTGTSVDKDLAQNTNISFNKQSSQLNITSEISLYQADIIDLSGNIIQAFSLDGVNHAELQLNGLRTGIYFARIQTEVKTIIKKIIIP